MEGCEQETIRRCFLLKLHVASGCVTVPSDGCEQNPDGTFGDVCFDGGGGGPGGEDDEIGFCHDSILGSPSGMQRCERLNNAASALENHPNSTCQAFGAAAQDRIDNEDYRYDPDYDPDEDEYAGASIVEDGEYTGVVFISPDGFNSPVSGALMQILAHEEAHQASGVVDDPNTDIDEAHATPYPDGGRVPVGWGTFCSGS